MSRARSAVGVMAGDADGQKGASGLVSSSVARELLLAKMQTVGSDLASSGSLKGKKHVDDVIRDLEAWNAKWFQDLVVKVKGELTQTPPESTRSSRTSSGEASTPRSSPGAWKLYQPTIEDVHTTEDEYELGRRSCLKPRTTASTTSRTHPASPSSSHLTSPLSSASPASAPSSPASNYSYGNTPVHSRPSSPSATTTTMVSYQLVKPSQARPSVRFSDREPPPPPPAAPTITTYRLRDSGGDANPPSVDARWRLFNEQGEPTPALGRLLRGIANYILTEFSPRDSLVITPDQLYKFYTKYKVDGEVFPFLRIFDTRYPRALKGLEFLYLDLRCAYLLAPSASSPRPHLPALTPSGFQEWTTLFLRAAPDLEARRLDLIARDVPLLAPRPLAPDRRHPKAHALVASSLDEWRCVVASSACTSASSSPARRSDRAPDARDAKPGAAAAYHVRPERGAGGFRPVRGREREPGRHADVYVRSREPSPPGLAERSHRKR